MKAAIVNAYGPASSLILTEVDEPTIENGQVKIALKAAAINPIDWKIRNGEMAFRYGNSFPKILGFDMSGIVVEVAKDVSVFCPGDEVYARGDIKDGGAYAEFNTTRAGTMALKPTNLSFEEAAAVPLCAITALQGLRDCARLQAGQHVLINGASGGVGVFAIQLAKIMGATVTGVCSDKNANLCRQLGADHIIDYNTQAVFTPGHCYDAIYDAIGNLKLESAQQALRDQGVYMTLTPVEQDVELFHPGEDEPEGRAGYFVLCAANTEDLDTIATYIENGSLRVVIDSVYPLSDIQNAHLRSESARAVGKIVIKIN